MNLTSTNGLDKSLKEVRADLVAQLKARATNGPIPSVARTQRKVDLELATEARVSVGLVHAARRGVAPYCDGRGAVPPRSNARYSRWQRLVSLCQ